MGGKKGIYREDRRIRKISKKGRRKRNVNLIGGMREEK